jgi:tRNA pseudouridine38-40 synthase
LKKLYAPLFGRTDTGVHARFFVAHFDTTIDIADCKDFLYKINALLPQDIAVYEIYPVKSDVHARYTAISRTYKYCISRTKDPFTNDICWYYAGTLDLPLMNKAGAMLLNCTDFTSFSKLHSDVKTNNCLLSEAIWSEHGNQLIFTITGNRFLRNMVRSIVGTTIDLGRGKINLDDFSKIIAGRNRSLASFSAPAHGLALTEIVYPQDVKVICRDVR